MPETVIRTIGPGHDFESLAAFAAALPASLVAADQIWVAELTSVAEDPGGAQIRTVCDETRYVHLRAAPGQGFADLMDPDADVLAPTLGLGALIRTPFGDALRAEGVDTRVHVTGLQIIAEDGAVLSDDGSGAFVGVERILADGDTSDFAITLRGANARLRDSAIVQRGGGGGVRVIDGGLVETSTITKPERLVADGIGIVAEGGSGDIRSSVVFGFRQAVERGNATVDAVATDQVNGLGAPDNFADPYWTKVGSIVNPQDTIPGPYNVPLQRLSSNQNAFARFDGPSTASGQAFTVPVGAKLSYSVIVAQNNAQISAILFDSSAGRPELRVFWTDTPPTAGIFGLTSAFQLVTGTVTDLGGGAYRLLLEAVNTTAAPLEASLSYYVTRGSDSGVNVSMYAGAQMAGVGHLGEGWVGQNALSGTNLVEGVDPDAAILGLGTVPDMRPVESGPLVTSSAPQTVHDIYYRPRIAQDTLGAVSLNTAPVVSAQPVLHQNTLDPVRLIDNAEVVTAQAQRRVLASGDNRRCPV